LLLLMVRHGLTDVTKTRLVGRLPGVNLNARGRAQAISAADRIAGLPVAAIYSSPLERAVQTALPLAERLHLEPVVTPGLLEVDYGEFAGQEYKALQKTELWKLVHIQPSAVRFPGGESLREAQDRIVGAVEDIAAGHSREVVVAFSHADPIRLAVAHFCGIHLDLYQRLTVFPGSVSALHLGQGLPTLVRLNDAATLEDLKPPRPRKGEN
jgi:probable phosphoglycerate mutase